MPVQALLLVIVASLAHASWNILIKKASGSKHLLLFSSVLEALLFLPAGLYGLTHSAFWGRKPLLFLVATGVLHLLYTECLVRGYRAGDLSVVYPLARGSGPLLSFFGAALFLRERLSVQSLAGAFLISIGILLTSGGLAALRHQLNRAGLFWGVATGATIASYTLVDGYSVKALLISPLLVEYAGNFIRTLFLAGGAATRRSSLRAEFSQYWKYAIGIAVLTPIGYILVLFAMTMAPVSHVAPVREMSMMIGAYFGVKFLREGNARRRILGSALIAVGVAVIATS